MTESQRGTEEGMKAEQQKNGEPMIRTAVLQVAECRIKPIHQGFSVGLCDLGK